MSDKVIAPDLIFRVGKGVAEIHMACRATLRALDRVALNMTYDY